MALPGKEGFRRHQYNNDSLNNRHEFVGNVRLPGHDVRSYAQIRQKESRHGNIKRIVPCQNGDNHAGPSVSGKRLPGKTAIEPENLHGAAHAGDESSDQLGKKNRIRRIDS